MIKVKKILNNLYCCGETRLGARCADVNTLAVLVFRLKLVVVDATVVDGVIEKLRIDYVVLQPNAFSTVIR